MGNRGNIFVKQAGVYLYAHWDGSELVNILKKALIRGKDRWNDPSYLARIIFSEMVRDDIDGTTGYGISDTLGDGGHNVLRVDTTLQTVNDIPFRDFIK